MGNSRINEVKSSRVRRVRCSLFLGISTCTIAAQLVLLSCHGTLTLGHFSTLEPTKFEFSKSQIKTEPINYARPSKDDSPIGPPVPTPPFVHPLTTPASLPMAAIPATDLSTTTTTFTTTVPTTSTTTATRATVDLETSASDSDRSLRQTTLETTATSSAINLSERTSAENVATSRKPPEAMTTVAPPTEHKSTVISEAITNIRATNEHLTTFSASSFPSMFTSSVPGTAQAASVASDSEHTHLGPSFFEALPINISQSTNLSPFQSLAISFDTANDTPDNASTQAIAYDASTDDDDDGEETLIDEAETNFLISETDEDDIIPTTVEYMPTGTSSVDMETSVAINESQVINGVPSTVQFEPAAPHLEPPKFTIKVPVKPSPLNVTLLAVSSHQLQVVWSRSPLGNIYYSLQVIDSHHVPLANVIQTNETVTTYMLSNLTAGTMYTVSVVACNQEICGDPTSATNYTYPAEPTDVRLISCSVNSLLIVWTQVGEFVRYSLLLNGKENIDVIIQPKNQLNKVYANISNLPTPGDAYHILLQTHGHLLSSAELNLIFHTAPATPARPASHNTTVDSVVITWYQRGVADNFTLSVDDEDAVMTWQQLERDEDSDEEQISALIDNLSVGGRQYDFSVKAWSGGCSSDVTSLTFNTRPYQPGPLQLLNRTTSSLLISWQQSGVLDDIDLYINKVSIKTPSWQLTSIDNVTSVRLSVSGLSDAGGLYNVSLAAMSRGYAGIGRWIILRTLPEIPVIQCLPRTNTSIILCTLQASSSLITAYNYSSDIVRPFSLREHRGGRIPTGDLRLGPCSRLNHLETDEPYRGWVMRDLYPGATYQVRVQAIIDGDVGRATSINCTTPASPPLSVAVTDINETVVRVTWKRPDGHFDGFKVDCIGGFGGSKNSTLHISHNPPQPVNYVGPLHGDQRGTVALSNSSLQMELSEICKNLTSGALYNVTVSTTVAVTPHSAPSQSYHHVTTPCRPKVDLLDSKNSSLTVSLLYPYSHTNALCSSYVIQLSTSSSVSSTRKYVVNCTQPSYTVGDLDDNSLHEVSVSAQSFYHPYVSRESRQAVINVWTLAGIVRSLEASDISSNSINATWSQPLRHKNVGAYKVTVSNSSICCGRVLLLTCSNRTDKIESGLVNADEIHVINCNPHELSFLIQPLVPASNYTIALSSVNRGGVSESVAMVRMTREIAAISLMEKITGAAVGCVLVIVIAIAVILVLIYRRKPKQTMPASKPPSSEILGFRNPSFVIELEDLVGRPRPIRVSEFSKHVATFHQDSDYRFSSEYALLNQLSMKHDQSSAELPVNRLKNRYSNILPFDHSRVKLIPVDDDEEGSDYINASYVPGQTSKREFIATQGPLKNTIVDFWRMVWQQKVYMIVMVTNLMERNKEKCSQYWPSDMEPVSYGSVRVQLQSQSPRDDYTLRCFNVTCGNRSRVVKQLHFSTWADFGCPDNANVLLNFIHKVRAQLSLQSVQVTPGPLLVHCSAGVGRTGTFILVDRLLQQIKIQNSIDIFSLVLEMRGYRCNMIQTEAQYIYAHECIKAALEKHLHVPGTRLPDFTDDEEDEAINSSYSTDADD